MPAEDFLVSAAPPPVRCAQVGWLPVTLGDPRVRDDALCRMDAAHRRAHLKLWTDLSRLAGLGYAAAPATLLAFTAWQAGNGVLAKVALDRALDDDPGCLMARILRGFARPRNPAGQGQTADDATSGGRLLSGASGGTGRPALAARHEAADGHLST
jgi:hypothetical protein